MWDQVLGAALAGIFGIVSAIYLDKRKEQVDRRLGSAIIGRELKRMVDWRQFLLSATYKNVVYGKFVPVNSLLQYRPLLEPEILPESRMELVEEAYRDYEMRDRMMEIIVTMTDGEGKLVRDTTRKAYWEGIASPATTEKAEALKPIIDRLLLYARRSAWHGRLLTDIKHGLGI